MVFLQSLPAELLTAVLHHLSAPQIARMQQVSASFRDLVRDTLILQYKIKCYLLGAVDVPSTDQCSLRDKLDSLEKWRQAWKRPFWNDQPGLAGFRGPRTSGPLLAERGPILDSSHPSRRNIQFYLPGSRIRHVDSKSWTLNDLGEIDDFAFDWYEDLLVIARSSGHDVIAPNFGYHHGHNVDEENRDHDGPFMQGWMDGHIVLRFNKCTTGEPHPDAQQASFRIPASFDFVPSLGMAICGDIVAVRMSNSHLGRNFCEILVIDWKQGRLLMRIEDESIEPAHGYALLDPRHIVVVGNTEERKRVLALFDCYGMPTSDLLSFRDAVRHHATAVLELPSLTKLVAQGGVLYNVRCAPNSPTANPAQTEGALFRAAGAQIVLVSIRLRERHTEKYDLVIPGAVLPRAPRGRHLPWREYSHACRLFRRASTAGWSSVQGSRYAVRIKTGRDGECFALRICDFDEPTAVLRDADVDDPTVLDGRAPAVHRVVDVQDHSNPSFWAEPMHTGAPYLETRVELARGAGRFMLVEDGVVMSEWKSSQQVVTVYTF